MELFSVRDKIIVITGSSKGIGKTLAIELSKLGAKVWIHGREEELLKKLSDDIGCKYCVADLNLDSDIEKMASTILNSERQIDVLINNAGFEKFLFIEDMDMELYDSIMNVCTRSHYYLTRLLLPHLKKSISPSIINMSSIHQSIPVRGNSPYCMAKAAMEMFTKVASLEFAKYHIKVNGIAPGAIKTDMNSEVVEKFDFDSWIPLGRVGETCDIVGGVVYLASSASSYVTGTTLFTDGGYSQNLLRY